MGEKNLEKRVEIKCPMGGFCNLVLSSPLCTRNKYNHCAQYQSMINKEEKLGENY